MKKGKSESVAGRVPGMGRPPREDIRAKGLVPVPDDVPVLREDKTPFTAGPRNGALIVSPKRNFLL